MTRKGSITLENPIKIGVSLTLEGPLFSRLLDWKPRPGEAVTVSDSDDVLFRARVLELHEDSATLLPFEEMGEAKAAPEIILLQALPERERMETIIQKTTELGVTSIIPFKSEKSVSLDELDGRQRRSHNWGTVALKAAKQSRRPDVPEVMACSSFQDSLKAAEKCELKILLREGADKGLKEVLSEIKKPVSSAVLLVGPEGGFLIDEVKTAASAGFIAVNLGLRILRTETAAIFGVGVLRYELGG